MKDVMEGLDTEPSILNEAEEHMWELNNDMDVEEFYYLGADFFGED